MGSAGVLLVLMSTALLLEGEAALLEQPHVAPVVGEEEYFVETHQVTTEDGYVLQLHRIPGSDVCPPQPGKIPVLLQHSYMSSSDDWLVPGPYKALGYKLVDEGYDVWLGNTRGNKYSSTHVSMSSSEASFWDFSFHEQAVLDLPTTIDHILSSTGQESLFYIGHSTGNTLFYMMASTRPEYNAKIRMQLSLSPAAFLRKLHVLEEYTYLSVFRPLESLFDRASSSEFMSSARLWVDRLTMLCKMGIWKWDVCASVLLPFARKVGYVVSFLQDGHLEVWNWDVCASVLLPFARKVTNPIDDLSFFSVNSLRHFVQMFYSGIMEQYDYGVLGNLLRYMRTSPPGYDLARVTCSIVLVASSGDMLSPLQDMELLKMKLQNVLDLIPVEDPMFRHTDFLVGSQSRTLVYDKIVDIMRSTWTSGDNVQASLELRKANTFIVYDVEEMSSALLPHLDGYIHDDSENNPVNDFPEYGATDVSLSTVSDFSAGKPMSSPGNDFGGIKPNNTLNLTDSIFPLHISNKSTSPPKKGNNLETNNQTIPVVPSKSSRGTETNKSQNVDVDTKPSEVTVQTNNLSKIFPLTQEYLENVHSPNRLIEKSNGFGTNNTNSILTSSSSKELMQNTSDNVYVNQAVNSSEMPHAVHFTNGTNERPTTTASNVTATPKSTSNTEISTKMSTTETDLGDNFAANTSMAPLQNHNISSDSSNASTSRSIVSCKLMISVAFLFGYHINKMQY